MKMYLMTYRKNTPKKAIALRKAVVLAENAKEAEAKFLKAIGATVEAGYLVTWISIDDDVCTLSI